MVDSREVAEWTDRNHKDLLRDIRNYIEILEKSTERKIAPSDFFIPHVYQDSTSRTLPCYLLTKKGCDMVANKMTGEKGVLFTAANSRGSDVLPFRSKGVGVLPHPFL